jgi:hypothetical protein
LSRYTGIREEQLAQILQRGIGTYRDDVRARRHDLTDDRLGEVHDRLEQLAAFLLRYGALLRLALAASLWRGNLRAIGAVGSLPLATRCHQVDDHCGDGQEQRGNGVEGRQHDVEHGLGIERAHDEQRQEVLADDDEGHQRDDEGDDGERVLHVAEPGDEHPGQHSAHADQNADRDEQLEGIVEVLSEAVVAPSALGHQPQRQSHERTEGGLDRSQEHRRATEQEQSERSHPERRPRSISPSTSPPLRRRRRSRRAIRPSSCS